VKEDELVRISEEIECIRAYLNIISIRYENKFTMEVRIEEKLLNLQTPKMILQPIVENAVYHGLERVDAEGELKVIGHFDANGDVCFTITDSGRGMDEEKLVQLREKLNSENSDRGSGKSIGLPNINNRIKLLFGESYGVVEIVSRVGYGTTVTVKIPALE
jgi:two-component system sensor histidine kinase YesM